MEKLMTRITLVPEGKPIFDEEGWDIEIDNQAAGEFVVVRSNTPGYDKIAINPWEWEESRYRRDGEAMPGLDKLNHRFIRPPRRPMEQGSLHALRRRARQRRPDHRQHRV